MSFLLDEVPTPLRLDYPSAAMPFVDGPDCRLWVEILGEEDPVTVFAHGITSSTDELRPLAARAPGTRVLFDFRGHGRSESPPEEAGYGIEAMRRDLAFVADRFGAVQALGVSMGADALASLIAGRPDRFRRLVFFLPAALDRPSGPLPVPALAGLLEQYPPERAAELALAAPEYAPLFAARPHWRRLVRARILRMNAVGVPRALRAFAVGPAPVPDARALHAVTAPALVLAHRGDPVHDEAVARRLAALLPNAQLRVWPEPLAMYDDAGAFARLIGAFLAGTKILR